MTNPKISFVTVCMNRLHHLRYTLPQNLLDNIDNKVEFLILDYNSKDGLEQYVRSNLMDYIEKGNLLYFRSTSHKYFLRSHSRNLAFKLSSGEIVCNIDADNYTGKNFFQYVLNEFSNTENIFLNTLNSEAFARSQPDVLGRICISKKHFDNVSGFDERMELYGFEDYDLINRLKLLGIESKLITNPKYLRSIQHSKRERLSNEYVMNNLQMFFISHITPHSSELLYMFNDLSYSQGTMLNNMANQNLSQIDPEFEYSLEQERWKTGKWQVVGDNIYLFDKLGAVSSLIFDRLTTSYKSTFNGKSLFFYRILHPLFREEAISFYSQMTNRLIMQENVLHRKIKVNLNGYGCGMVVKNFDKSSEITIV